MILTNILYVKEDSLVKGHPYIPAVPRRCNSLALITSGKMRYTVNHESIEISSGEILFIRAGSMDCAETADDFPVRYITMDFCTLEQENEMQNLYRCGVTDLFPYFLKILSVFQMQGADWLMESIGILYQILKILRRTDMRGAEQENHHLHISKAIEQIQQRISDPALNVRELANVCKVSTVTLNHFFKQVYRMTASEYLLSRRMLLAKTLLLNLANTVGEVAKSTGYSDIYAFSHAFFRCFGVSPSTWRKHPNQPLTDYE